MKIIISRPSTVDTEVEVDFPLYHYEFHDSGATRISTYTMIQADGRMISLTMHDGAEGRYELETDIIDLRRDLAHYLRSPLKLEKSVFDTLMAKFYATLAQNLR